MKAPTTDTPQGERDAANPLGPSGPLGFNLSQHSPTTRPSVERTAEKAFTLSDRVQLSSAEAPVQAIKAGNAGVGEGIPTGFHAH